MCPSSWGYLHLSLCLSFVCLILLRWLGSSPRLFISRRLINVPLPSLFQEKVETTLSFYELLYLSATDNSQLRFQSYYLLQQKKGSHPDWILELKYNRRNNDARTWNLGASCKLSSQLAIGINSTTCELVLGPSHCFLFPFLAVTHSALSISLFCLFLNKTFSHERVQWSLLKYNSQMGFMCCLLKSFFLFFFFFSILIGTNL